jgi:hypothetical protein
MTNLKIFISSTMEDLKAEREFVAMEINNHSFWEAVFAENFVANTLSPKEVCLNAVEDSHVYVGIFGDRYGFVPERNNPLSLSVVEIEYRKACECGRHILLFVHKNGDNREKKLADFLDRLMDFNEGHFIKEFASKDELAGLVVGALEALTTKACIESIQLGTQRKARDIYGLPYFKDKMKAIG